MKFAVTAKQEKYGVRFVIEAPDIKQATIMAEAKLKADFDLSRVDLEDLTIYQVDKDIPLEPDPRQEEMFGKGKAKNVTPKPEALSAPKP